MNLLPFQKCEAKNANAVTTSSASVTFTGGGASAPQFLVCNTGAATAYVEVGPTATAAGSQSVPAGAVMMFTKPDTAATISFITATGSTTLDISAGNGT